MDDLVGFAEKFLPASEAPVVERWNSLLDFLRELPRDRDSFGLIHQDLHGGNFFVDDERRMTIFDFDDCQYFWYAHDIAMALFYVIPHDCREKRDLDNARLFMTHFMRGYRTENQLESRWMGEIPVFIRLREMDLYIAIHRSMDLDNLDKWCASFMNGRRDKILGGVSYIDIDFSAF